MDTVILTADRVHAIMIDCLFKNEELVDRTPPDGAVLVDGVVNKFGLHPERLAAHKAEVETLLAELPDSFRGKNGDSFLNAFLDRNGRHWGEHRDMQALMVLGAGLGLVWVLPREMWRLCPGGVPLFGIKDDV